MAEKTNLTFRRAEPKDAAGLALVGQAAFLEAFAGVLSGADILTHCERQHAREKYASWLADANTAIWLAEVDGAPVGYLVLTTPDLPVADVSAADTEVKRVYVLHRFQGMQVGARLMSAACEHARAKGCRRVLLGVYGGNDAAIAFYEKRGFRRIGRRSFQVGANTYDDLVMGLELAP